MLCARRRSVKRIDVDPGRKIGVPERELKKQIPHTARDKFQVKGRKRFRDDNWELVVGGQIVGCANVEE
jgi:hypothetical protein